MLGLRHYQVEITGNLREKMCCRKIIKGRIEQNVNVIREAGIKRHHPLGAKNVTSRSAERLLGMARPGE